MPDIRNAVYRGTTGTFTIDGDKHYGVTSCALVPTSTDEAVVDISGDVQGSVDVPTWRLQIEFHQDHKTAGALSRESIARHGEVVPITYQPQNGGDTLAIDVIMKAATVGGNTGRRSSTLDLPCEGQPDITPATP